MFRQATALVLILSAIPTLASDPFTLSIEPDHLVIQPEVRTDDYRVTLQGPFTRLVSTHQGDQPGVIPLYDEKGEPFEDGSWSLQIDAVPVLSAGLRNALTRARESGDEKTLRRLWTKAEPLVQSGHFIIRDGETVAQDMKEPGAAGETYVTRDQIISDDLIVNGSACIGFDCVNGESFGNDSLRMKEVNLRIHFQDTSTSPSYPTTDWRLSANDSTSGGQAKFTIDDVDGGVSPFTIEANAPANALYVDDGGRIGRGTSTPATELHIVDGDSPKIRLEQDTSASFAAQTWDIAGNESNFFVADVTGGTQHPFRIESGADTGALHIGDDNAIGMGTASPSAALHLTRADGSAMILVEDTDSGGSDEALLKLVNEVKTSIVLTNNFSSTDWEIFNGTAGLRIDDGDSTSAEFEIKNNDEIRIGENGADWLLFDSSGNATIANDLTVNGTFTDSSDINRKEAFAPVDPTEVLETLAGLEITTWQYRDDARGARHMGVMAQDFFAAFGLGHDDRYLTSIDRDGVAMAAIIGLHRANEEKEARIRDLEARLAALEDAMAQ